MIRKLFVCYFSRKLKLYNNDFNDDKNTFVIQLMKVTDPEGRIQNNLNIDK